MRRSAWYYRRRLSQYATQIKTNIFLLRTAPNAKISKGKPVILFSTRHTVIRVWNLSTIVVGKLRPRIAQASSASVDMVTGIETAGLVLAVLPLIIQALSAYNGGLEKTGIILGLKQKRYKLKVERLRLRLEGQSVSLHINLAKLIGRADPAEDITCLPEKYDDILWTGAIAGKIKAYLQLGNTFEIFKDTLSMYQSYLEEIAGKLVGILWPPKVRFSPTQMQQHRIKARFTGR